jgi:hypothetical protein
MVSVKLILLAGTLCILKRLMLRPVMLLCQISHLKFSHLKIFSWLRPAPSAVAIAAPYSIGRPASQVTLSNTLDRGPFHVQDPNRPPLNLHIYACFVCRK